MNLTHNKIEEIEKAQAQLTLRNAIASNKIQRLPCEVCGKLPTDGHHMDYSKPLEVVWLCRKHHKLEHGKINRKIKPLPRYMTIRIREADYMRIKTLALEKRMSLIGFIKKYLTTIK